MLPHISQSTAGNNRMDPVYQNIFELYFTIPAALQSEFGNDVAVLTEQVKSISGLESLDKAPGTIQQTFLGSKRTYLASRLDDTSHELEIVFQLNLRNGTDNFIYKLLKAWNSQGYNMNTGATTLKTGYVADWMKLVIGNRGGDIFREIIYKDVFPFDGLTGWSEATYDSTGEAVEITMKLKSDWAVETNA